MTLIRRLLQISVFLWIFSIPLSLAYHWNTSVGLVHGVIVDYRVPSLSVSSILLLITLFFYFMNHREKQIKSVLFLLEPIILMATVSALLFQSIVALYQFFFQKSLTGYLPFGEVSFSSQLIAKGTFFMGNIYKLPYGTTVHPNVLAGFSVVVFLLLLARKDVQPSRKYMAILFLLVSIVCFLTQSVSAACALLLGSILHYALRSQTKLHKIFRYLLVCIPLLSFLFFARPSLSSNTNSSIARRSQLQTIAIRMITTHPLTGIGWNNFTLYQESYGYVASTVRFLQPVHNVFLLLIAELGITGWVICIVIFVLVFKARSSFLPVIFALIFISSFDHYFLTLTTGRMLLLLCILIYFLPRRMTKEEV